MHDVIFYAKGHGTGNDFILLPDPDGMLDLSADEVARICQRRTGLGADGILRVVRTSAEPQAQDQANDAEWFMDYRNADGSTAEMCGNGARVFARFLVDAGWAAGEFTIATRSGLHQIRDEGDATFTVEIGSAVAGPEGPDPQVHVDGKTLIGDAWWLPNPHAVVFVDDVAEAGSLSAAPRVTAGDRYPDGQNIEFAVDLTDNPANLRARMRVYERGVGETLSCGTGACAVALSIRSRHEVTGPGKVSVELKGGLLTVILSEDGRIQLNGPAVMVAHGSFEPDWWEGKR